MRCCERKRSSGRNPHSQVRNGGPLVLLITALALASPAMAAGDADVTVLLDAFDNVGCGTKWVIVGLEGTELQPDIVSLLHGGHDGGPCAQVSVGAGASLAMRREFGKGFVGNGDKETLILPGRPVRLGLWVKGNSSQARLTANVSGAVLDFGTLDFDGWRHLERDIPAGKETPPRLREIRLDAVKAAKVDNPAVCIDDLTLVTRGSAEAPLFIDFERMGLDRQLAEGDTITARLRIQNLLPQPRRLKMHVDLTTGKTAVVSTAQTLRTQPIDVELPGGEARTWTFEYPMPAGIYYGLLEVADPATGGLLADRRIEYAVFPAGGAAGGAKDFVLYDSGLCPMVMLRNDGPKLRLFQGLSPYGLGGPSHVAFAEGGKCRVAPAGKELDLGGMSEAWMVFWFHGAAGWDKVTGSPYPVDVPMLVVFQHKPVTAVPAGTGWEFRFPGAGNQVAGGNPDSHPTCGHVGIVPLYGVSFVRAASTGGWEAGMPADVIERCRLLSAVSREYPVAVEEKFKVDPAGDVVTIRNRFEYLSIDDDWKTPHRKLAPLEYMTAAVHRAGFKPLEVQGKVLDLDFAVGQGVWAGVEGTEECTYTLRGLLKYVNVVEQPKAIPAEEPLLADARKNFDVRNALWHRFHNSWWAEENLASAGAVGSVLPYLDKAAQDYARLAGKAVAAYTLNPNNLVFEYDSARGISYALDGQNYERMGWTDAGPTSNEALRAAYKYTVGTGDRELIRQRWAFLRSFYNVPVRTSHWGDSAFNSGGGDTFGSNLNGTIAMARMACWVGDEDTYKFACYHTAKQLVALYGICQAYPRLVVAKDMWGAFQETFHARLDGDKMALYAVDAPKGGPARELAVELRDIPFTDLRGANLGIVPWCMVQRTSDSQERFIKDYAPDYAKYMIDGLPNKWLPKWHKAVYVDQAKVPDWPALAKEGEALPSWFRDSVGPSIEPNLQWWDFHFDTPPAERRVKLERFYRNNHGSLRGREFDVILAGLAQTYKPVWDAPGALQPQADDSYRMGLQRVAGPAGCPALAVAAPKFEWPTLVWEGLRAPSRPAAGAVGALPLCGIVPDETKISFAAARTSPNWGLGVWSAEYLRWPVLTIADELNKLPMHLRSIIIERDVANAPRHVANLLKQSELTFSLAGPFPYYQASDFDTVFPPEQKLDLAATYDTYKINNVEYRAGWKQAQAKMYLVDFCQPWPHNEDQYLTNAQVYAVTWVMCPDDRDAKIALGSDDGAKVWVNGTLVWKNWVHRGSAFDQDVFPIHLRKGWNVVLTKVFNRTHGCGFEMLLRITDDRMLPFGDLEFRPTPP